MEDPGAPLRIQDLTRTIVGDGARGGGWGFWNIRRLLVFSNIPTSGAFGKVFFRRLSDQLSCFHINMKARCYLNYQLILRRTGTHIYNSEAISDLSPYSTGNGVRVRYQMQMKSTQKNMKCTWPTPVFCVGTQRNLYSTDLRRGLASGKTQILALGNAKIFQHVGISNAKFWCRGHCPTPTPDARYFASQWNIGLNLISWLGRVPTSCLIVCFSCALPVSK